VLNDLVARAFAGLPVVSDSHRLTRSDGKRPDGFTMVPWKEGKPLTWDVTVVCRLADLYVDASARDAGLAAELVALWKADKYSVLDGTHFQRVVVESIGPLNTTAYGAKLVTVMRAAIPADTGCDTALQCYPSCTKSILMRTSHLCGH